MKVLIADGPTVAALLPMKECISLMERTLLAVARGQAVLPLRSALTLPGDRGLLFSMPAALPELESLGVKVITIFPANRGAGLDPHQGVILLFEAGHGQLRAIVDATSVTAIRTAAVSAVATKLLARPGAERLALLGAGTQARTHLEAMLAVRPLRKVRVHSRTREGALRFAAAESERWTLPVEVSSSAREAVEGADVVCTVTTSREPVLRGAWLPPGAHVNAVGAYRPEERELDSDAVSAARLYVDRRESALREAGEILVPIREGRIREDHIQGELGELLAGTVAGRQEEGEVTLFKSLGIAVEDLAAAAHVLEAAETAGVGRFVEIGGAQLGSL